MIIDIHFSWKGSINPDCLRFLPWCWVRVILRVRYFFCTGIVFEAHTPLGRPGLSAEGHDPIVLDDPVIKEIAAKHNATAAQVSRGFAL